MIKKKFDINGNYLKMNILYMLLIISNIVLLMGLIYHHSNTSIHVNLDAYEYFSSAIPTIIILGIITSKLSQLREERGPLYEIASVIMITIIGFMISYFGERTDTSAIFGPYLEMFRVLSVILIFIIMATTMLKPFKEIQQGKFTKKNLLVCFIIFTLLGVYATWFHIYVNGAPANVRCMVVMISGLFGGPFVGIPVGLISGAVRYSAGGVSALPCALSTVISGIVGSLVFIWNDKKFPKPLAAATLMFLFVGFEMLLVVMLSPPDISFPYVQNIYPLMLFSSVVGIILFTMVVRSENEKMNTDDGEESVVDEIEEGLKGSDEVKELKDEIAWLKKEVKKLKRSDDE